MELVGAGFGEDLHASITQAVILRGERVLVDPNLTYRRFWWKLATGKPVDVDLPSVRTGSRTGKGRKLGGELVGVIGEGFEILALDDGGTGV